MWENIRETFGILCFVSKFFPIFELEQFFDKIFPKMGQNWVRKSKFQKILLITFYGEIKTIPYHAKEQKI